MPSGYVYSWTGKVSGAYNKVGNWYNNTAGAAATAVPGTNDRATIVATGSISGPGAAFQLGLTGTGSGLSVGGTLYGGYAYVGGTVTLASGAALGSANLIDIGDNSSSAIAGKVPTVLTVGAGSFIHATLATANSFDVIVGQGGGSGTLAVTGGGIASAGTAGVLVGNGGTGVISVSGGGIVQAGTALGTAVQQVDLALGSNGGSGALLVGGANSLADFTNTVEVGFGGTGSVSVTSGGTLYAGEGLDSLNIGDVYNGAIGNGSVSVDASTAYLAGVIEVGAYGQGNLSLSNGAHVVDYFNLSGKAPAWSALIGVNAGSKGTLSLSSQSSMVAAEGIAVGSLGSGELDVSNAVLSIYAVAATGTIALDAGVGSGSVGVVNVSGGLIDDAGQAGMVIGGAGNGSLVITQAGGSGGVVQTGSATNGVGLAVAVSAGSVGNVSVSGAYSALGVAGEMAVGLGGQGNVAVSGGARLVAGPNVTATGLVLGSSGGSGALSVSGASQLVVYGQTDVGLSGAGTLSITGGGGMLGMSVGNAALVAGASAGTTGSVLISDTYSYAGLTGGIAIGNFGSGTLTVQNQAYVVASGTASPTLPVLTIGAASGSDGTVTLASRAEMTLLAAGAAVGVGGDGLLSVNSATLTVTTSPGVGVSAVNAGVSAGSSGTVNVSGGLIIDTQSAGVIIGDGGNGTLAVSQSGTQGGLVLTGDPTGPAGLAVGVAAGSSGVVSVSGAASGIGVYGTAQIGGAGQGELSLTNGGHLVANLGVSATGLVVGASAGGAGTLSVASGAQAYVVGQSIIGQAGVGSLSVTGGSSFTGTASGVSAMVLGASSSGTGSLLISDTSSFVPLTGGLVVGSAGTGSVVVQNAGVLAVSETGGVPALVVGYGTGSTGSVLVSGPGSKLLVTGGLEVGVAGTGTLTVTNGGLANVSGAVSVGSLGSVLASGGTMSFLGAVTGSGSMAISGNGLLSLGSTETNAVAFGSGGGTLVAPSAADIGGLVSGWSAADFIDLQNVAAVSDSFANGTLSLFGASSQLLGTLQFAGALTASNFTLTALAGGTEIGFRS